MRFRVLDIAFPSPYNRITNRTYVLFSRGTIGSRRSGEEGADATARRRAVDHGGTTNHDGEERKVPRYRGKETEFRTTYPAGIGREERPGPGHPRDAATVPLGMPLSGASRVASNV